MRLPLATKRGQGRSIPLSAERLINMYAEKAPDSAKSPVVVHGCPGYQVFSDVASRTGGTALGKSIRGMHKTPSDGLVYAVMGSELVRVGSDGLVTQLGTIAGSGRVGMADNGVQLCIVAGARGYIYDTTNGLQTITDRDFNGADHVTVIDGFFVFNNRKPGQRGQFYISALLDGLSFDGLDFATAERYSDNLIRPFADHSELLLFGAESIEVWFNSGNADFPFSRAQGSVIEQGLGASWSVEKLDESVVWLDNEGIVRRLSGITPVRISTHEIENAILKGDWANAYSWAYVEEGHQFYVLTVPAANLSQTAGTYVYDAATQLWHERKSYEKDYLDLGFYVRAYGKHLVADENKVYELGLNYYDEAGQELVSEMIFPQIQNDGKRFTVHSFQLEIETGNDPYCAVAAPAPTGLSVNDLDGTNIYFDYDSVLLGVSGSVVRYEFQQSQDGGSNFEIMGYVNGDQEAIQALPHGLTFPFPDPWVFRMRTEVDGSFSEFITTTS